MIQKLALLLTLSTTVSAFTTTTHVDCVESTIVFANKEGMTEKDDDNNIGSRRGFIQTTSAVFVAALVMPSRANAEGKSFAPGGTLVDYEVGVTVGNAQASKSRKTDNSNVVFNQDYYYKFGTAPQWIESENNEFPKTMPFTLSQQRYDTMKKYRERVQRGVDQIVALDDAVKSGNYGSILDGSAPEYYIRPMGLMANGFLASENTGTTNELLLSRWYINEISLDIDDIKNAKSKEDARFAYEALENATNSYLSLLNRVITPKVGDKLPLIGAAVVAKSIENSETNPSV